MTVGNITPSAIIVEQGKIIDFIDNKTQRLETPEEYVRQEIAKSLVREYGYAKADIEVEFILRLGTRKPRADLIIMPPETDHTQENAHIIVECKASTVKAADKKDGVGQLQSYMAACPNVQYGMWTNGIERFCYRRIE
jgi:type I restriction enzyme M protein